AASSYLKLFNDRETGHIDSLDVTMTGFKAHHNLALIYLDMGCPEAAEHHFRQAVADNRTFLPSWGGLRESLVAQQKWAEARESEVVLAQLSSATSP
ncbi:MAG: tetratricopeptide repeat protein, partial [Proteobacteria bacterium]